MPISNVQQAALAPQIENVAPSAEAASHLIDLGREVLEIEAQAILDLRIQIGPSFVEAIHLMLQCRGRVVVSGIGKSGHIARKIAATLASTGTPAFFVHPAEANHGDLGMVTKDDVFLGLSNSGEAAELLSILPILKRMGAKLIAMTGNPRSSLAELADVHLYAGVKKEAGALNLAPTASTTAALALGDALAVVLLDQRGFSAEDFARSHPGGSLGRRLLTHVRDVMRIGVAIPSVGLDATLTDALLEISRKGMAMTAVIDSNGKVAGIFTDGDLRRLVERTQNFSNLKVVDVMHANPRLIGPERLAAEAADLMEQYRINQLLVADASGILLGALHIHDLTTAKVI